MALLHSRVGRVFYLSDNPINGGLSSLYKLHAEEGLNHHFEVYRVVDLNKEDVGSGSDVT